MSTLGGKHVIITLGGLYIALAAGWGLVQASLGTFLPSILVGSSFIGGFGFIIFAGGYRLPETDIHPDFYSFIAVRCLGGLGLIILILLLYELQPAVGVENTDRSVLILTGFGAAAGFGVGRYDAQAKSRAREIELQNQKLQRIQDELEESNKRLEQFAYAASHDLQEPLRMISSYLQLIGNRYADELDEDGEEFLEYAIDGSERMKEMIDGLLEYSRVNTQGKPLEPVDLNEIVTEACKNLEIQITESNADIESDELPRVNGDASQLHQLFQNLLSNAIEYSGDQPPRIEIFAERTGKKWKLSVRDEGIGIDPEDQAHIFDVFERLHSHEEHAGTGIGLALCKRIVERHDGEMWVDSEPGEGATFSFMLPAVTE
ncbi:sensor histidine kinase [Natronococcus wangiae]|uniref:sensor histidine kinase n=1 Tax=Natronococcus wangiae TaxID=3068275 RepID=UPI00273F01E6|nr:ATP-binding protein [Natronococcus sp. AD5]